MTAQPPATTSDPTGQGTDPVGALPESGPERGAIYGASRRRISELVASLTDEELGRRLSACPDWTVRDVIGHLTGLVDDARAGRVDGFATPEWTQAQVQRFAHRSLAEVLADWAELAEPAEADLDAVIGALGVRLISDAFTHEHDIRGAVGRPGGRESSAFPVTLRLQLDALGARLLDAGLPALELVCADGRTFLVGEGEAGASVQVASTWELLRAITARRSRAQVAGYVWEGPAADFLGPFFRFAPPSHDVEE